MVVQVEGYPFPLTILNGPSWVQWNSLLDRTDQSHNVVSFFFCINRNFTIGSHSVCYRWTVSVLSDHPRWMFKKNSMEFSVGLQLYLYYYYSGCTLKSHGHMFFPECSMITWPCHVILTYWVPTLFISLLHCMLWGFGLSVQMWGKPFSCLGLS